MKSKGFLVIYEDNHLIIVNKDAGVLTQGDETGDEPLAEKVKAFLKEKYDKQGNVFCGVIHRLDRPVSGLVILAKTSKGLERMNELFRNRKIAKVYWAVSHRAPEKEEGRLVHWLSKDERSNTVTAYEYEAPDTQKAELRYKVLGKINHHYLIEVTPITGRPHQIRVQLAKIGCPIRGDIKYGAPKGSGVSNRIYLHSRRVNFIHPVKNEPIICVAGLPKDAFWEEFLELDNFEVQEKHLSYFHGA